jgi:hypothetical protein
VMVTPRWVKTRSQPIAIGNVLTYLVACLSVPATTGRTLDIGGLDVVSYLELMRIMAEERGLRRRLVIPVPVLTPHLSSLWIHLVTPLSHRIARPLAEGLRNPVVCRDDEAARLMPQRLLGVREAIRVALEQVAHHEVETGWFDAGPIPGDPDWAGGTVFVDQREVEVAASPEAVFATISRIGGETGWYGLDWLWRLRGTLDRLAGGPGLRRGRRHAEHVAFGDAIDFWRVAGRGSSRPRASRRAACSASLTGTRSCRSTASCSVGCWTASAAPPSAVTRRPSAPCNPTRSDASVRCGSRPRRPRRQGAVGRAARCARSGSGR